ncbi:MAG TPA: DsbA family protein [Thermomicrobiales bacterium]|nr:DsbA family protein [Thermomicrobiales bacterium]
MSEPMEIDVYYDYGCPYVYRAGIWMRDVQAALGPGLRVNWRYFPLEQVNSDKGPDWKLWEQADDFRSRGLPAFRAAEAARQQGDEAFRKFHLALLQARHEAGADLGKRETLLAAAEAAGLDRARFERDLADRAHMAVIGRDYTQGRNELGVFGTPTFVFGNGRAAYIKLTDVPSPDAALPLFERFTETVRDEPLVEEIKRPRKPEQ